MLDDTESAADIYNAATQLGEIIQEQIRTSFGDINYARAIEEMDVMRKELIELEEPQVWNEWIKKLKGRVLRGELGGDRREMWAEIRKHNLGLVSRKENVIAGVGEDESRTVSYHCSTAGKPFFSNANQSYSSCLQNEIRRNLSQVTQI